MKKQPEATFYNFLKRNKPKWIWTRIESITGSGIPDISVLAVPDSPSIPSGRDARHFWLELKVDKPILRLEQYAWCRRYALKGGNVWVAVRRRGIKTLSWWGGEDIEGETTSGGILLTKEPTFAIEQTDFKHQFPWRFAKKQ